MARARASLHEALSQLWRVRMECDVAWILAEPIAWVPRELNQAADHLATCAAAQGLSAWFMPPSGHGVDTSCVIAFCDGSSNAEGQGWGACLACRTIGGWTVVAAEAWRGPQGTHTVPALEGLGMAAATRLLLTFLGLRGSREASPPDTAALGLPCVARAGELLRMSWPPSWPRLAATARQRT